MERAEPEQPPSGPSSGRFVAVGVGLAIVALGVAAGGVFRPIGTDVVDRSSAISRAIIGLAIGAVVASAVMIFAHQRSWWKGINKPLVGSLAVLGIAAISLFAVSTAPRHAPEPERETAITVPPTAATGTVSAPRTQIDRQPTPRSSSLPKWTQTLGLVVLIIVVGMIVVFIAKLLQKRNRGARPPAYRRPVADTEPDTAAVDAALESSIGTLLDDPDPRVAIKAAYATLLDALETAGFPRIISEAPNEHLARCLQGLRIEPNAMQHLLDVYAVARYSTHDMTETDRATALGALRAAQVQLRQRSTEAGADTSDDAGADAAAESPPPDHLERAT